MAKAVDMDPEVARAIQAQYIAVCKTHPGKVFTLGQVLTIRNKKTLLEMAGLDDKNIDRDAWPILWEGLSEPELAATGIEYVNGHGETCHFRYNKKLDVSNGAVSSSSPGYSVAQAAAITKYLVELVHEQTHLPTATATARIREFCAARGFDLSAMHKIGIPIASALRSGYGGKKIVKQAVEGVMSYVAEEVADKQPKSSKKGKKGKVKKARQKVVSAKRGPGKPVASDSPKPAQAEKAPAVQVVPMRMANGYHISYESQAVQVEVVNGQLMFHALVDGQWVQFYPRGS